MIMMIIIIIIIIIIIVIIIKKIKNSLHLNHRFLKEVNYAEAESFIVLAKRPIKSVQIQIKILKRK